jgi:hypothetical protein
MLDDFSSKDFTMMNDSYYDYYHCSTQAGCPTDLWPPDTCHESLDCSEIEQCLHGPLQGRDDCARKLTLGLHLALENIAEPIDAPPPQ